MGNRYPYYVLLLPVILVLLVILSGTTSAVLISSFDNQSSPFNIIFTGNQNATYNMTIYRYANITSATINLSGSNSVMVGNLTNSLQSYTLQSGKYLAQSFNVSQNAVLGQVALYMDLRSNLNITINGGNDTFPNSTIYASGNISSAGNGGQWYNITLNNTVNLNAGQRYWVNFTLNWNFGNPSAIFGSIPPYPDGILITDNINGKSSSTPFALYTSYPTNAYVSLNRSQVWNYTSAFSLYNNQTSEFSSALNALLANGACTGGILSGSNCTLNFTFHSDSVGILQVFPQVTWLEYTSPNLTLIAPNDSYGNSTALPLNFSVSDNVGVDSCWYNLSIINASGSPVPYVANTYLSYPCVSQNTNFTLPLSGTNTWVMYFTVNDSSNNINTTSKYFSVSNYIAPVIIPSGGGGGSVPANRTWSMFTEQGSKSYVLNMIYDTERTRNLQFTNLGQDPASISLSCDGDLCPFITLENSSVNLPVDTTKVTSVVMKINIPSTTTKDLYTANIKAVDGASLSDVITVQVTIGGAASVILDTLNKLGTTKSFPGISVPIPYVFMLILSAGLFFIFLNWVIFKDLSIGFALSFIFAVALGLLVVALL